MQKNLAHGVRVKFPNYSSELTGTWPSSYVYSWAVGFLSYKVDADEPLGHYFMFVCSRTLHHHRCIFSFECFHGTFTRPGETNTRESEYNIWWWWVTLVKKRSVFCSSSTISLIPFLFIHFTIQHPGAVSCVCIVKNWKKPWLRFILEISQLKKWAAETKKVSECLFKFMLSINRQFHPTKVYITDSRCA